MSLVAIEISNSLFGTIPCIILCKVIFLMNDKLFFLFFYNELEETIDKMTKVKVFGSIGVGIEFCNIFWNIKNGDNIAMINQALKNSHFLQCVIKGHLTLFYKGDEKIRF